VFSVIVIHIPFTNDNPLPTVKVFGVVVLIVCDVALVVVNDPLLNPITVSSNSCTKLGKTDVKKLLTYVLNPGSLRGGKAGMFVNAI